MVIILHSPVANVVATISWSILLPLQSLVSSVQSTPLYVPLDTFSSNSCILGRIEILSPVSNSLYIFSSLTCILSLSANSICSGSEYLTVTSLITFI